MTDTNALSLARIGRLLNWIGLALAVVAALGLAAWLTGCVVSDRYYWSQFLAWIPTPYALGLAALGCLGAARRGGSPRGRRRRLTVWITATMILGGYFTVIEHRMLARPPAAPTGLRLTHWTMSHSMRESDDHARRIAELAGDITVLSDASNITWNRVA